MKKSILTVLLAALVGAAAAGQNATAVYVEGDASRREVSGRMSVLDIGDGVKSGETVMTKKTGRADLELENRSTITVRPDTVFTLGEVELEGEKQSVFSTSVGSVAFRLNKFSGRGPVIRTNNIVAGVRGTEFTVYAGMDGSSLLVVEQGEVEVSSQGAAVSLLADEAVEVRPGLPPGEKFTWLGKEQDFRSWNEGKLEEFLKDPVDGIRKVETQLAFFQEELERILPDLEEVERQSARVYEELNKAVEAKDEENVQNFREELIKGVGEKRRILFLNKRYYALSYFSMRRFVVSGMYLEMKSRYILNSDAVEFKDFLTVYAGILRKFEDVVIPHLVDADI